MGSGSQLAAHDL